MLQLIGVDGEEGMITIVNGWMWVLNTGDDERCDMRCMCVDVVHHC